MGPAWGTDPVERSKTSRDVTGTFASGLPCRGDEAADAPGCIGTRIEEHGRLLDSHHSSPSCHEHGSTDVAGRHVACVNYRGSSMR